MSKPREKQIGVTAFKSTCLSLVEEVAQGKIDRVVLTKRGLPVAEVVRAGSGASVGTSDPWGALQGTVRLVPGFDLTEPLGIEWDAESGVLLHE